MRTRRPPKVRRIRKAWHDGLRSLPNLAGKRPRTKEYTVPDIPTGRNVYLDVTDDDEANLARALGDDALARRVRQLQRDRFPYGTAPEMVIYDFLERKGEEFVYQAQLFGGYRSGGLVPDFVVSQNGTGHVLLIQGIYWHNIPGKREKDQSDKLRMIGANYNGDIITKVTFIWENRIMCPNPQREQTLTLALQGIETGQ